MVSQRGQQLRQVFHNISRSANIMHMVYPCAQTLSRNSEQRSNCACATENTASVPAVGRMIMLQEHEHNRLTCEGLGSSSTA